jgi:hypothetical protein
MFTAKRVLRRSGCIVGLTFCVGVLACDLCAQPGSSAELPPGAMQAKVRSACTECHESRIIVQQRLSKAAWTKEVDKMIRWGAVVDQNDRDGFIEYLSGNFSPDKPPYAPERSAKSKK